MSKYHFLSFINSHFGTNLTTEETDMTGNKNENIISKAYNNMIYSYYEKYKRNIKNNFITPDKPPTIDISELTKDKFITLTDNFTKPVIVKGFIKNSYAVKNWSLDYFSQKYGDLTLPIIKDADVKKGNSYIKDYDYVTIKNIVKNIKEGNKLYMNNVSRIFGYYPKLLDELNLEQIKKYSGLDLKNSNNVTHMFMGGKNTGTTLHASYTGNFFFNVKGIKKWILIDPIYSKYLLPTLSRSGLFTVSKINIFKNGNITDGMKRYQFTLEEGDLLFNPPWWWHAVKNETKYTIGCANRFSTFFVGMRNNPLYTTIMCSHPIKNFDFAFSGKTKAESNINFDKSLLQDMLRKNKKI